jgi:hypothetical protein
MDNNFVKDRAFNEPLLGIRENVWNFTTEEKKDNFAPSTTGLLRLTSNGSQLFDQGQFKDFFNTLLRELSAAVPVNLSRLTTNRITRCENENQYVITIGIMETRDEHDNSVASIIKLIDTMVRNKDQSPIGLGQATAYLDETYGLVQSRECLMNADLYFPT